MPSRPVHLQAPGAIYHQFQLVKSVEIPELQCHLYELIHLPTKAQVMHIANDDPENLFCLSFQTHPLKSDGVAHILEHTVLCGSKKYPVKDPFFAMTRRSLNTFMNALTGSDFTCYPAATQIPKDFYNLLEVYLDAVFHPNLDKRSFYQEGHRLEFADPSDYNTPLEHKGVVYNEMKGAMSSPGTRGSEVMHAALFPDITYGINSGGNPTEIAKLTYDELVDFYKQFYHPSRCLFFFYGNMSLEKHLDFIHEKALKDVKELPPLPPIPKQPRLLKPRHITATYPISPDESPQNKTYISFGWLTSPIVEQEELLALNILEIILLDTDASPLKMALLKSGFCKLVSSHIDTDVSENPFVINLRGCNPENADALEKLIKEQLQKIVDQGVPLEAVENAIHQLEFYRSEINGDQAPFGLSLFMRSALLKQHFVPAEEGLKIHSLFESLHQKILKDPHYLTDLLKKHLLDNTHFVRLVMTPDQNLNKREAQEERDNLDKLFQKMSDKEKQHIVTSAKELSEFQKRQESVDIDLLPKVTVEDVPKTSKTYELLHERYRNLNIYRHHCFTNKILYADLIFNLPFLKEEELSLAKLMTYLMPQMGSGGRSYSENLEYIQAHTGGVGVSLGLGLQASDHTHIKPFLHIRGRALQRKSNKLFPLLYDTLKSCDFTDKERIKEVLHKHYTSLESSLNQNALQYAINLSASGLDIPSKISNEWWGLKYFWKIKDIVHDLSKLPSLIEKLQDLQGRLLGLEDADLILTLDASHYDELKAHGFYGLDELILKPYAPWKGSFALEPVTPQARLITSTVSFTAKVFKTIPYAHPDAPALAVTAALFDNLVLHRLLREKGGAYGGGASFNSLAGSFYFYSYRDPNIASSLVAFDRAIKAIHSGKFTTSDLHEATLEIVQSLDDPAAPGSRGFLAYSWLKEGKTLPLRQAFRDRLLSLKKQDIIHTIATHIQPNIPTSSTVVFGGLEILEKENLKLTPPLPIEKI